MIKTYVYTQPMNNVSHVLTGQGGNTVRFNFTNGNTITKKLPELTLRGKYYQDLLEGSELFLKGLVRKLRETPDPSDTKEEQTAAEAGKKETVKEEGQMEEVKNVRTTADVIAYINERFDSNCKTLASAMKYASKNNIIFPDFNE